MSWWDNLWQQEATDWTFAPLQPEQTPEQTPIQPVVAGAHYLNIFLRSLRIVNVRKGLHEFFGTVHSFVSLPHSDGTAEFHIVTTPNSLRNIAADHLDRIIVMNQRLLGPIPYSGGDLNLELGLFSIRSQDLAAPFLGLLETMATAAGVSYMQQAAPFIGPIRQGIDLLTGSSADTNLEIGIATKFPVLQTGTYLVMRAPKGAVDLMTLRLGSDYRITTKDGRPLEPYPYLVFSIEATTQRPDWAYIPDLAPPYAEVTAAARSGDRHRTETALDNFRRAALTSADLLLADAQALAAHVEEATKAILDTLAPPAQPAA